MMKQFIAFLLALSAPMAIYWLGSNTNFIHNTSPLSFICGATLITAIIGTGIAKTLDHFESLIQYAKLFAILTFIYSGIAYFTLYAGYFFWFIIPIAIILQAIIAKKILGSNWRNILVVIAISGIIFLAGGAVSYYRDHLGVTNENYFISFIFFHPQLSIFISCANRKRPS